MFDILLNVTYLAAIAMSLYSAVWLLLKADRNRTVCAFIACQLLIVVWCVPQLFLGFVQSGRGFTRPTRFPTWASVLSVRRGWCSLFGTGENPCPSGGWR